MQVFRITHVYGTSPVSGHQEHRFPVTGTKLWKDQMTSKTIFGNFWDFLNKIGTKRYIENSVSTSVHSAGEKKIQVRGTPPGGGSLARAFFVVASKITSYWNPWSLKRSLVGSSCLGWENALAALHKGSEKGPVCRREWESNMKKKYEASVAFG